MYINQECICFPFKKTSEIKISGIYMYMYLFLFYSMFAPRICDASILGDFFFI